MSAVLQSAPSIRPTRVMVVDDSVVVRGLVGRWIGDAPGFEVVATASNGRVALERLAHAEPDIVLLDLDMPEVDGVEALPQLLRARPDLSVVVVSTLTQRNAEISLRCLQLGATDYLPKPSGARELTLSMSFRDDLLALLRGLAARHQDGPAPTRPALPRLPAPASGRPQALVIGASTGGPRALTTVLSDLKQIASSIPILVVQHLPAIFTTVFARQLADETGIEAYEGRDGEPISPGRIYLAPGGRHMGLKLVGGMPAIRIDDGPAIHHCRPALDVLLTDAASVYGGGTLAVVLTGMGSDGLDGARRLATTNATIIVQDKGSSVVWGMPGSIAKAGLARAVLPIDAIATAIAAALRPRQMVRPA